MTKTTLKIYLEIICFEDDQEWEDVMELARDEFISRMLKIHQANSSQNRRLMIKNAKIEKVNRTLSTFVQHVDDFKFWVNLSGRPHRIPDKISRSAY